MKIWKVTIELDVDVFFVDPSIQMIDLQIQEGNKFQIKTLSLKLPY